MKALESISLSRIIETDSAVFLIMGKGDLVRMSNAGEMLMGKLRKVKDKNYIWIEKTKNKKIRQKQKVKDYKKDIF